MSRLRAILSDFYHLNILPLRHAERNVWPLVCVSALTILSWQTVACLSVIVLSSEGNGSDSCYLSLNRTLFTAVSTRDLYYEGTEFDSPSIISHFPHSLQVNAGMLGLPINRIWQLLSVSFLVHVSQKSWWTLYHSTTVILNAGNMPTNLWSCVGEGVGETRAWVNACPSLVSNQLSRH